MSDQAESEKFWKRMKNHSRMSVQRTITELALPLSDFRMTGIRDWQWIERKVEQTFYTRPFEKRQDFPFMCIEIDAALYAPWPIEVLSTIAPGETPVYAAIGDESLKLWWCEGTFESAAAVFSYCEEGTAMAQLFDMLLVPKTFDWLITVNHHDALFAVGQPVAAKVAEFAAQMKADA